MRARVLLRWWSASGDGGAVGPGADGGEVGVRGRSSGTWSGARARRVASGNACHLTRSNAFAVLHCAGPHGQGWQGRGGSRGRKDVSDVV